MPPLKDKPKKRDGAIIDLEGVSKRSKELLVHGEAIDVDILSTLPKLETLEVYKIPARHVPKLERLDELALENLSLRFWGMPDLTDFRPPKGLKNLSVWQSNKLVRLDGIEAATQLETLVLNDNGPLETLEPIRALPKLTGLHLVGGIWTKQKVNTLEAIAGLETLRHFTLRTVDGRSMDLTPITQLPNLETLDLWARDFPIEEVAKVAAAHPMYLEELLDLDDVPLLTCDECGTTQKLLFLKGRKAFWCPVCRKKGLDKLLKMFLKEVEEERVGLDLHHPQTTSGDHA